MTAQPFSPDRTADLVDLRGAPLVDPTVPATPSALDLELDLRDGGPDTRHDPAGGAVRHAVHGHRIGALLPGALAAATRRLDALVCAVLVLVTAVVNSVGLFAFPSLADDEGTYVAQAMAVRGGELTHYTFWYDHPPLGWIQLGMLDWLPQLLLPGVQPVAASRVIVVLAACVSAWLTYVLGRRLGMRRVFAALAVVVAFASPLGITMHRQVYLDNIAVPWLLLSFVLVLDRRQRLWSYVAAGLAFAVAVGTKETTVVLAPVLLWIILSHGNRRTRTFSLAGFLGTAALVGYYPLMALLRGELLPGAGHVSLLDALNFQLLHRPGSGAMWIEGSSSHTVLLSWLYYDPWVIVLGIAGLPVALAVRRLRPLGVALLLVVLVALKPGGYLPAMYVIVALPLLGLAVAATGDAAWNGVRRLAGGWGHLPDRLLRLSGGLVVAGGVLVLAMAWAPGLSEVTTQRTNDARTQAEGWAQANLPRGSTVLTDDVTWVSLVRSGTVERNRAIWFYKLDTDPEVRARLTDGWRDVDYLISTDQMRGSLAGDPTLSQSSAAMRNSELVARFGAGESTVEIRRVLPGGVR